MMTEMTPAGLLFAGITALVTALGWVCKRYLQCMADCRNAYNQSLEAHQTCVQKIESLAGMVMHLDHIKHRHEAALRQIRELLDANAAAKH
ncbi:MAG: hypothetical protein AB7P76_05220 [Candidatus Melainabacteria bacterium]